MIFNKILLLSFISKYTTPNTKTGFGKILQRRQFSKCCVILYGLAFLSVNEIENTTIK